MSNSLFFFSGNDIRSLLSMEDCIDGMKTAFSALSNGEALMPVRTRLDMEQDNSNALFMPVYLQSIRKVGIKTVTNCIDNPARGLPMIHAMVMIFDSVTGVPLAVMDGEAITAMRTGAVSGLATSLLARENASIGAIIGTGAQGETQLEAICTVREIEQAYVFDLDPKKAEAFALKMKDRVNIEVIAADSITTLKKVDIICTATPSHAPVFSDIHLKSGVHINGVGAYKPDMIEIPSETIARAKIVVDQRQSCLVEAGDLIKPIQMNIIGEDHIHGELGDVVTGKIPARENNEEITVFKSVGLAVQDLVSADLVLKAAQEKGVGTELALA